MNARILLCCLTSLVLPSVLAGCTLLATSISIPDPTDQNAAESGPASISGTLTVQGPLLKVGSASEALDTFATMGLDLDAHLYAVGGKDPAQFHYLNDYQPGRPPIRLAARIPSISVTPNCPTAATRSASAAGGRPPRW